jgi:uncharacterized protein YqjF (DUF2071 family)
VRTYVYPRGRANDAAARGVWFFSLDAASRLAVWGARTFWGLPYHPARIHLQRDGDVLDYGVDRIDGRNGAAPSLRIRWRALDRMPRSQPGDLAHFLTERYCLYAQRSGCLMCGRIEHVPWSLRRAQMLSMNDSLLRAAGIEVDPAEEPVAFHSDELNVRAWRLERV